MTEQEPVQPRTTAAFDGGKRPSEDTADSSAPVEVGEAPHLTDPDAVDTSVRTPTQRSRAVTGILVNTALSTTVTILIEPDRRANANGLAGMVQGLMFIVTSVLSGLTALAFVHLRTLRMPEEVRAAATDAHGGFALRGSLAAVLANSGLFALILFSTFNTESGRTWSWCLLWRRPSRPSSSRLCRSSSHRSPSTGSSPTPGPPTAPPSWPRILGEGTSRGIAPVFLVAGAIMVVATLLAFLTHGLPQGLRVLCAGGRRRACVRRRACGRR